MKARNSKRKQGHTPGPWEVCEDGITVLHEAAPIAAAVPACHYPTNEDRANARLIASAPELLAALEDMTKQADIAVKRLNEALNANAQTPGNAPFVLNDRAARAAIAKATEGIDHIRRPQ